MTSFWKGKRVFLTGHTGFKGSWLSIWLNDLGAEVYGFSLDANYPLFQSLGLEREICHTLGDICDSVFLKNAIQKCQPDVVFHLAAQPLVRRSYKEPLLTWQTNVLGTMNILEGLRSLDHNCAVVIATTDKVYENREWVHGYREVDPLGGKDPYSSSKAAAEIAVASWRDSFFLGKSPIKIATARAGNVIGGGDWAEDRIIPDMIRALSTQNAINVRNPGSVRPWQHVLEPLSGYLTLARNLYQSENYMFQEPYNFGPGLDSFRSVKDLIEECLKYWPGNWRNSSENYSPHEAGLLGLAIDKANVHLGWKPKWGFQKSVEKTIVWYRETNEGTEPRNITLEQIRDFSKE